MITSGRRKQLGIAAVGLCAAWSFTAEARGQETSTARPAASARADGLAASRPLPDDESKQLAAWAKQVDDLSDRGDFQAAAKVAREAAALRSRSQGVGHRQTKDAIREAETLEKVAVLAAGPRAKYARLGSLDRDAEALESRGQFRDGHPLREQALAIRRKILGEDHPGTAESYNNMANNLNAQVRYADAHPLFEKALAIRRKALGEDHPDTAQGYNNVAYNLGAQGRFAEAQPLYEQALAIWRKALGEDHADTAAGYNNVAGNLDAQGRHADAQPFYEKALTIERKALGGDHPDTARGYNNLAHNLNTQGRYADAQPLYEKALAISRKAMGEDHADTARGYINVAANLRAQGRYVDAHPLYEKALAIWRQVLGEDHPNTAQAYNSLAGNLNAQGRYADAQPLFAKSLVILRRALGEDHPHTADGYGNLAGNLNVQGRYADAQPLFEKSLAIRRKALGEGHPNTAIGYINVATNLNAQGRFADAQPLYEQGLASCRKALGEDHPNTAKAYMSVATNLNAKDQFADAEPLYAKALAIARKALGEDHPDTAASYNGVAANLKAQGRYTEAHPRFEKALAIWRKALGEDHPDTARAYNNIAANLRAQGRYADAQPLYEKALAIWRKSLGNDHPDTARGYNHLAANLYAQGRHADAERQLAHAADAYAKLRGRVATAGVDRAAGSEELSPAVLLACLLARRDSAADAWGRYESGLARGLLDDLSARANRPISAADRNRELELSAALDRLDARARALAARAVKGPIPPQERDRLEQDRLEAQAAWSGFQQQLEKTYGVAAGQAYDLDRIQTQVAPDAALVGWLDYDAGEHWAVVVRRTGPPRWVALSGRGKAGTWTEADKGLGLRLAAALADRERMGDGSTTALQAEVAGQRIGPLEPLLGASGNLPAVRRLIALPSPALRGVPLGLLAEAYTVSYAPSGTVFAWLREQPRRKEGAPALSLLVVADPDFTDPSTGPQTSPTAPPANGVFLASVQQATNAERSGLRSGDVLLTYAGRPLDGPDALAPAIAEHAQAKESVPVTAWRDGQTIDVAVAPGKLGVQPDKRSAREAILADREFARMMRGIHDGGPIEPLPGTRREAASIVALVQRRQGRVTALVGPDARESTLRKLARQDELRGYRFVHLATHGVPNLDRAFNSELLLARGGAEASADVGEEVDDGRLTAAEVMRDWKLDSELVTLSACQSAVGRYAGGEGYLGFTQALLLAGSRSVVLSLWKVDDRATALLMGRFYANLLGQRQGLSAPLPKAEALREAQHWLRTLEASEADSLAAAMPTLERGQKVKDMRPPQRATPAPRVGGARRPHEDPYYWAAFILVGDPS